MVWTSPKSRSDGCALCDMLHDDSEKTLQHVHYLHEPTRSLSPSVNTEHSQPDVEKSDVGDKGTTADTAARDPNVIDWDSEDDPRKALNWSSKKKWINVGIIAGVTFLTPLASSMIAPGVPLILEEFGNNSGTVASLIVSIYLVGYTIGPLLLTPLSEVYGRLWIYNITAILFTIWNIACALAPNIGSLLVFRLFAGIAGSTSLTLGGGSIADCVRQEHRGGVMAIYAMGPVMGPVIGPVASGFLTQAAGWRWNFWLLAIAGGVFSAISIIFMRESYEPVLLQRHVNNLKKETGNPNLRSKLDKGIPFREYFLRAIVRPSKMFFLSPIVAILSIYMAIVYGYLYLLFTTLTPVFETNYGFNQGTVGLAFLGIGIGSMVGLIIFGVASDRILKRMSAKGEMKPEYRLPPLIPGAIITPMGLFLYGWSADKHVQWIVPIIGTGMVGFGLMATFMSIQTYLVDAFTIHAASAVAANTILRSLVGAFLPLAGPAMYAALGLGWGNSLLAFIAIAMSPLSWIFFKYGERIRKSKRARVEF